MVEGQEVWMEVEKGKFVKKPYVEPIKMDNMDKANLSLRNNNHQDYQKYVNSQIEKMGENNGEVRRFINRLKKDGEKRKCLINPEDLFRK